MGEWKVDVIVDNEAFEGLVLAETQDEAINVFLADIEGEIEEASAVSIHHVLMDRLVDFLGEPDPWGVDFTLSMVADVTPDERKAACVAFDSIMGQEDGRASDPKWHAARIAYLIANPERLEDPIEIDNHCNGGVIYPIPEILDGWHRYYAHLWLKKPTIRATYGGLVDLLEYLEGLTDVIPEPC